MGCNAESENLSAARENQKAQVTCDLIGLVGVELDVELVFVYGVERIGMESPIHEIVLFDLWSHPPHPRWKQGAAAGFPLMARINTHMNHTHN